MKIYDISQEIFSCKVFPGDPAPEKKILSSMKNGELYNLTAFSMCAHNGTHVDAPFHFLKEGKTIEDIPCEYFAGECYVAECEGTVSGEEALEILGKADGDFKKRILIKGNATVSLDAAKVFAQAEIFLLGNESQTVGPEDAPMAVHLELLSSDIILLEGIRLGGVAEGKYFLCAAPLCIAESDGAPCRALLFDFNA